MLAKNKPVKRKSIVVPKPYKYTVKSVQ